MEKYEKKKEDLVSIIMPAYNCEDFVGEAIDSVVNQTYDNWELIVVDDCSTDRTSIIVQDYLEKDMRIKYYRLQHNSGAAVARNRALDFVTGKYIAFLDSDDVWFKNKLSLQINYMIENNYSFTCTSYTKIDDNSESLNKTISAQYRSDYNDILKRCPGNSTVIYDAEKIGKIKIPIIKKRNDYVMWLRVIKNAKNLYGIKEPLSSHRVRNGSLSKNKVSLIGYHWKVYREIEKLSLKKSIYLIIYWVTGSILKLN